MRNVAIDVSSCSILARSGRVLYDKKFVYRRHFVLPLVYGKPSFSRSSSVLRVPLVCWCIHVDRRPLPVSNDHEAARVLPELYRGSRYLRQICSHGHRINEKILMVGTVLRPDTPAR